MAAITASRNPASTSTSMISPSSTITPMAVCHDPALTAMVNATKAFNPIPGAVASGMLA